MTRGWGARRYETGGVCGVGEGGAGGRDGGTGMEERGYNRGNGMEDKGWGTGDARQGNGTGDRIQGVDDRGQGTH